MSSVYGSPLFIGGSQQISDLPPLLSNFRASVDESQTGQVILSADKMEKGRAKDLAGAVWVYGDHAPKNANDGTRIELTRDEAIKPDAAPFITLEDIPVSDADTETIVNVKESDGQLHPYIYLHNNYENSSAGLLLRKEIIGNAKMSNANYDGCPIDTSIVAFKNGLPTNIQDNLVDVDLRIISSRTILRSAFALSMSELATNGSSGDGTPLPYFNVNYANPSEKRIGYQNEQAVAYWTRTATGTNGYYIDTTGSVLFQTLLSSCGVRPAICLKTSFKLSATPNKDGSYDMYEESSAQTLATGKTIADLPSKTKIKLGKYGSKDLIWLTTKNNAQEQFLILSPESTAVSPFAGMMLDNAEPTNPNSARKKSGSNRYIQSNLHQWLNSDKAAGEWYTAQHEYDAPPDYANIRGFLYEWSDVEKVALMNRQWKVDKAKLDGSGSETFFAKVVIPSIVELGYTTYDSSEFLDIFKTDDDRVCNDKNWWLRSPYTDYDDTNVLVYQYGSKYQYPVIQKHLVRPLVNIDSYTPVSESPDSDGCYTLMLSKPIDPNAIVTKTVTWDTNKNFYARQFTYNSKKQYQTMLEGATTELLLGEVPLPVSNLAISENAGASPTLSWKNPTDKNYHETVVVQNEGSTPPRSTDDGIEVYRGNGESVTVKDLQSTVDYSFGVFTLSPYGNYGEPSTISYRYDFPSEPTDYLDCAEISETTEYEIPEDGWFRIDVISAGGSGGNSPKDPPGPNYGDWATPGGGASGSHARSEIALYKGDKLSIQFTGGITVNNNERSINIQVVNGAAGNNPINNETPGTGGQPGNASGGNKQNENGTRGNSGNTKRVDSYKGEIYGGTGAARKTITITETKSYDTYGGNGSGADDIRESSYHMIMETAGNSAKVFISRGNTNIPSPQ